MKIFQSLLYVVIIMVSFVFTAYSQSPKSRKNNVRTLVIEPNLSDEPVFDTLDKQVDFQQGFLEPDGKGDSLERKTTNVVYRSTGYYNGNIIPVNCKAWVKSDTLVINIGSWDGYSGGGFKINYFNRKYVIEPYYAQHSDIGPDPHPPVFTIAYCNLKLDKPIYVVADTVHGYVDFNITERHHGGTITHIARGYFRDRIKIWWGSK